MRTTLGLGALATVGVTVWQGLDSLSTARDKRIADERAALRELTELWAKLPPPSADAAAAAGAVNALAAVLVRTADALCPRDQAGWFKDSKLANQIRDGVLDGCERLPAAQRPPACTLLLESADPTLQRPLPDCLLSDADKPRDPLPVYWLFDYRESALKEEAHPCDPVAHERHRAEQRHLAREAARAASATEAAVDAASMEAANGVLIDARCSHRPPLAAIARAAVGPLPALVPPPAPAPGPAPVPTPAPPVGLVAPAPVLPPMAAAAAKDSPPARSSTPTPTPTPAPDVPARPRPLDVGAAPGGTTFGHPSPLLPLVAACGGHTVYLQYYGAGQRERAEALRRRWLVQGLRVPPAEDVVASAQREGRGRPAPVAQTSVRHHDAASRRCALQLGPAAGFGQWQVQPLAPQHRAVPGVVEVWLAPDAVDAPLAR